MKIRAKVQKRPTLSLEENILKTIQLLAINQPRFRVTPRPMGRNGEVLHPELPYDLTILSDEALGRVYTEFSRMAQYAKIQLAARMVDTAVKRRSDRMVRAQKRANALGKNLAEIEARIDLEEEAQVSSFNLLVSEQTEILTQAILEGFIIGRDTCSREITRRIAMRERGSA